MGANLIAVLLTSLVWTLALPGLARAQLGPVTPVTPAVQDLPSKPIGKIVTATGSVTIERAAAVVVQASVAGQADQAKVGDLVYQRDVVLTGADGKVGINFTDGTSFNLSSNARMALDEFVYEPSGNSNSTLFSLSKGTFTFVAGKVAKTGEMKVDTPVATMGIRGTTPHVEILGDGSVKFSTLIEQGKRKTADRAAAPAAQPPGQKANKNLNICRGC